jgi:hypothetical protein
MVCSFESTCSHRGFEAGQNKHSPGELPWGMFINRPEAKLWYAILWRLKPAP